MRSKRGSVLILTVWALSFLAIFAVGIGCNIATEINFASYFKNRLTMYYLAKAGIGRALIDILLEGGVCDNEEVSKEVQLGPGYCFPEIVDESSKININYAPLEVLESLLQVIGEVDEYSSIDIANAIIDWRDQDIVLSSRGAEDDYYKSQELPYGCKNGKFQILEELLLVKGITPQVFSKIEDVITIYGGQKINVNTASASVFCALGLSDRLAEEIVEYRQGKDQKEGTDDDVTFESVDALRNIGYLFTEDSIALNRIISLSVLDIKSDVFRVNSYGILKDKRRELKRKIVCVVKRLDGKKFEMLYWHEE